ncbi:MAG: polysaccharide biosynthesis tyrosine autokinase, partial [Deltaproteobacteria bacterium]|nr:polysaccharide biosynthesis tyrosine autokinase [Deltaproteobacteria bacterium]
MRNDKEEQLDIRDYLRVILKRRWTLITVFVVMVITVSIHAFTATPIFEATTRLVIEKENPNVVSIEEVMSVDASGSDYYQTQYKIIESRTVARAVIKRLHLDKSEEFFPKQGNGIISNVKRFIKDTVASLKDEISSLVRSEKEKPASDISEEAALNSSLVSAFTDRIEVSPIRNSRLVDIGFRAKDPVLATRIANTLAQAYMDQNLEIKLRAVQDAVKWLHNRVEDERKKVEKAEEALLRYKEKHGIVTDFSSDVEHVTAQKLAKLNSQVVEAESERVEAETRYKEAISLAATPDMQDSIPEVLNNELIGQIKKMEVELHNRMSELSRKYGPNHPRMVAIDSELNTLRKRKAQEINRVINSLKSEYRVALAREKSLKSALDKQKKEALELNQKAIQYGVLKRETESARHMYEVLIKRFKETTLTENMKTGNIRIIDRAEFPQHPVKPKKGLNILLAIIVGLITGTGMAFFFEYLDNTVKTPEDVKRHVRIPYLGAVPNFEIAKGNPEDNMHPDLVTHHTPRSTASESYRGLRTNILLSSAETSPQIILVSSARPLEGKTVTAANLAVTMAQAGSKVIILDCDMRRPMMHNVFSLTRDRGISNLLADNRGVSGYILPTTIPNLDLIPCGPIPPNPSEMLGSNRMANLLGELRKQYARIIIDTSPSMAVTDPVVLS